MNGESRILAERLDMTFDSNPFRGLETRFMIAATGAQKLAMLLGSFIEGLDTP